MSEIKVNKISPSSGTTFTVGDSGDTFNIPSGVTLANSGTVTGLPASAINSGTLADARIPNLNTSKITAGTLDVARVPDLNASKITAGTIATARLGSGTASSSTFLRGDSTYASVGGGLEVADQWRLSADVTMSTTTILLFNGSTERVDGTAQGTLGSAMSVSSGIWTFPSTGIWSVHCIGNLYTSNNATGSVRLGLEMEATTDNSTYTNISDGANWNPSNQFTFMMAQCMSLVDVTDTSNVKIRVNGVNGGTNNSDRVWMGNTGKNETYITFIKLGAT